MTQNIRTIYRELDGTSGGVLRIVQTGARPRSAVVLNGYGLNRRLNWVFAPQGWDVGTLERRCVPDPFEAGYQRCLLTPSEVRALIDEFGEAPMFDLPTGMSLRGLLERPMLAVGLLLAYEA